MKKIVLICLVFVLSFSAFGCREQKQSRAADVTLKVWGIFDSSSDLYSIFQNFKQKYPEVKIEYRALSLDDYETMLLSSLAEDSGPDVFLMHNTWLPKMKKKIAPAPEAFISMQSFEDAFVQVAKSDLTEDGKIYSLPMYIDTLGLLYNYDHYQKTVKGRPRESWAEFLQDVDTINTIENAKITQSGLALGTTKNITQSTDILLNLFQQSQIKTNKQGVLDMTSRPGMDAFKFYTDFANEKSDLYTWNPSFQNDVFEFSEGKVSTIIGYSYLVEQMNALARTRGLEFRTAPFPQKDPQKPVVFADYWSYAVKMNAEKPLRMEYAWDLVKHMASKDSAKEYFDRTKRPPARRDLIQELKSDPLYSPFVNQALYAKSVKMFDRKKYNMIINEAIEAVTDGAKPSDALQKATVSLGKIALEYESVKASTDSPKKK